MDAIHRNGGARATIALARGYVSDRAASAVDSGEGMIGERLGRPDYYSATTRETDDTEKK